MVKKSSEQSKIITAKNEGVKLEEFWKMLFMGSSLAKQEGKEGSRIESFKRYS